MFGIGALLNAKAQIEQNKAARAVLTEEEWIERNKILAEFAKESRKERRHQEFCEAIRSTGFWSFLR